MIAELFTSRHWTDLISHDRHHPFSLLSPLNLPFPFSIHPSLYNTHSRFSVPFDVIAKSRSPWQQLVTSSSPTLSFDGCFYFGGLLDVARTSLAEHQVTCSGGGGTMLPSVGSKCLHTADQGEQQPAFLRWLTTVNHMATGTPHSDSSSLNTCMLTEVPLWKGQVTAGLLPLKASGMEKNNTEKCVCIDAHNPIKVHRSIHTHKYSVVSIHTRNSSTVYHNVIVVL